MTKDVGGREHTKVVEELEKVWDAFNHMEHELYADYVFDALAMLKEQDAVVRCKDCQFYAEGENEVDAWMYCRLHSMNTQPDNYCSWAVHVGKNDSQLPD